MGGPFLSLSPQSTSPSVSLSLPPHQSKDRFSKLLERIQALNPATASVLRASEQLLKGKREEALTRMRAALEGCGDAAAKDSHAAKSQERLLLLYVQALCDREDYAAALEALRNAPQGMLAKPALLSLLYHVSERAGEDKAQTLDG